MNLIKITKKTFEIGKITSIFYAIMYSTNQKSLQACRYNHWLVIGTRRPWGKFFSKTLFDAIAFGIGTKDAEIDDIHGNEVLESINKVQLD